MLKLPKHSCGDSRLSCVECSEPVCPKCMIECPVGNRCRKCAAKTESHVIKVTPWVVARTMICSALAAYLFTYMSGFTGAGYFGWLLAYGAGVVVGNLIHKVSGFKLGRAIVTTVTLGLLCGAALNPSTFDPFGVEENLQQMQQYNAAQKARIKQHKAKVQESAKPTEEELAEDTYEAPSAEQIENLKASYRGMMVWNLVRLGIFALGVITPFTGAAPFFSFFPFRRY